jgi:hypothetical protein
MEVGNVYLSSFDLNSYGTYIMNILEILLIFNFGI